MIDHPAISAAELYKCNRCFALELQYKWNLGMCPEERCGIDMCHPDHKNGKQAYLAVDATPLQGGIAFYTCMGWQTCFYYQPNFKELGIDVNPMRPTDFEMINLLIAIAAILQWCDNFGCTINEIFNGNTSEDEPLLKIADRLSRCREIREWVRQIEKTKLDKSWERIFLAVYKEIPSFRTEVIDEYFSTAINKILETNYFMEAVVPESYVTYECPRFRRMIYYFERMQNEFLPERYERTTIRSTKISRFCASPSTWTPSLPTRPNESKSWMKPVLVCSTIMLIAYLVLMSTTIK